MPFDVRGPPPGPQALEAHWRSSDLGREPGDEVVDGDAALGLLAPRAFTPTVPCSTSSSPTTSTYGTFSSLARRTRAPSVSAWASTSSARAPSARGDRRAARTRRDDRRPAAPSTCTGASHVGNAPGVVLEQDRRRSARSCRTSAVDHDRPVALVVGADVLELEALRHLEVELDGRHLPRAPDGVLRLHRDLGAVERAAALVEHQLEPASMRRRRAAPRWPPPTPRRCRPPCRGLVESSR